MYSNNGDRKWAWIIILFPLVGSLIYLYDTFYSRQNVEDLSEEIKSTLITNYKIDKLEKQLEYSDTISNRKELASEHFLVGNYQRALDLYKSCLDEVHKDDIDLLLKLVKTSYRLKDYPGVIYYGKQLKDTKEFEYSKEKVALAWSYYQEGESELANQIFNETNVRFSNYYQRLEYARFLRLTYQSEESKNLLQTLIQEIDAMDGQEKRQKRTIYRAIKNFLSEIG